MSSLTPDAARQNNADPNSNVYLPELQVRSRDMRHTRYDVTYSPSGLPSVVRPQPDSMETRTSSAPAARLDGETSVALPLPPYSPMTRPTCVSLPNLLRPLQLRARCPCTRLPSPPRHRPPRHLPHSLSLSVTVV